MIDAIKFPSKYDLKLSGRHRSERVVGSNRKTVGIRRQHGCPGLVALCSNSSCRPIHGRKHEAEHKFIQDR